MGESEAYKELYAEFPELINEIQLKYNKARDNNTRILGKIRAIEGLMNQNSPKVRYEIKRVAKWLYRFSFAAIPE